MVTKSKRVQFYLNKEFQEICLQNFQTDDVKEIQKLIEKFLKNGDRDTLSLKDQYLLARIDKLKKETPLRIKKLELENAILEKKKNFMYNFNTELSKSGSQILTTETKKQFGFQSSIGHDENIQLKKNFFINKIKSDEFCGVCKICQNFTTAICSTSQEAEGDIEFHLEVVHSKGLYQR